MFDAASLEPSWDFWILALLLALLFPAVLPAGDTKSPCGGTPLAARLAPLATPANG